MAITTVGDVVAAALRKIGVLAEGEVPSAQMATDALDALNARLDQMKAENLTIPAVSRTLAALTANQTSFTIGIGGNINPTMARPDSIASVAYINAAGMEIPLNLLNDQQYAALPLKALTGTVPAMAYYSPTWPTGTLYPLPIPTIAATWVIYAPAEPPEFTALTDLVNLPPGYRRMLITNLAMELCDDYERQPPALLPQQAASSLAVVKRSNAKELLIKFDRGALVGNGGGWWDIRSGTYWGQ